MLDQTRYISVIWVTATVGSAFTAGHFWKSAKSNPKRFAPTLGTSLTLGVPVIRQVFGGPPPRAIHGAGRLNRHPCRFTPQIPVEFRPACLTGRLRSKARSRSRSGSRAARFASWLVLVAAKLCGYLWPLRAPTKKGRSDRPSLCHLAISPDGAVRRYALPAVGGS